MTHYLTVENSTNALQTCKKLAELLYLRQNRRIFGCWKCISSIVNSSTQPPLKENRTQQSKIQVFLLTNNSHSILLSRRAEDWAFEQTLRQVSIILQFEGEPCVRPELLAARVAQVWFQFYFCDRHLRHFLEMQRILKRTSPAFLCASSESIIVLTSLASACFYALKILAFIEPKAF